jgi:hypothetical protein
MLETEIKVTPELAAEHGLTAEEYARIQKILGAIRTSPSWASSA